MNKKFHDKVINLLPSKDLVNHVKAEKFVFDEEALLKFINDYAPDFNTKLKLFGEAVNVFESKTAISYAKKLIAHNEKAYAEFMRSDKNCVYEIKIKCFPDDADEEKLLTCTFDEAIEMIKCWLKCYRDVGAKDNILSRYTITKKTTNLPRSPRDIYKGNVGELGECVLGYKFNVLDVSFYALGNEIRCKSSLDCEDCKTPCVSCLMPSFPHFLNQYDLVAYYQDRLNNTTKPEYGIFAYDMDKCDSDSYFIHLDNEYIKNRKVDCTDENGYYEVYNAHSHPSYAELFKPDITDVPKEIYDDYLYAVEVLKHLDD